MRTLVVVLGDQLDPESAVFDGFDSERDRVWMAEVCAEAERVWSHKARIALFISAMRHFRDDLRARGRDVAYVELAESTLGAELAKAVDRFRPERVVVTEPGEWRVREELLQAVPGLEIHSDRHFLCSAAEFRKWAKGRLQLRSCYLESLRPGFGGPVSRTSGRRGIPQPPPFRSGPFPRPYPRPRRGAGTPEG